MVAVYSHNAESIFLPVLISFSFSIFLPLSPPPPPSSLYISFAFTNFEIPVVSSDPLETVKFLLTNINPILDLVLTTFRAAFYYFIPFSTKNRFNKFYSTWVTRFRFNITFLSFFLNKASTQSSFPSCYRFVVFNFSLLFFICTLSFLCSTSYFFYFFIFFLVCSCLSI